QRLALVLRGLCAGRHPQPDPARLAAAARSLRKTRCHLYAALIAQARTRSACLGAAHEQQSLLDVPPGLCLLALALLLQGGRLLGGFGDGLRPMRLEQLTRIILNVDWLHESSSRCW